MPATPLLLATKDVKLLKSGKIIERDIRLEGLGEYDRIILINALNDSECGPVLDIETIID